MQEVRALFHRKKPPRGIICDLVDYGDYVALRFYRDNFDSRPDNIRVAATEWAVETKTALSQLIPCSIEAWETPPEDK